jgi:hypothetical protein
VLHGTYDMQSMNEASHIASKHRPTSTPSVKGREGKRGKGGCVCVCVCVCERGEKDERKGKLRGFPREGNGAERTMPSSILGMETVTVSTYQLIQDWVRTREGDAIFQSR